MIALSKSAECCVGCGEEFGGKHVCYWEQARVCTDCHTEFAKAAEQYEMDEWEREWREGDRVPGAVVGLIVAALLFAIVTCVRWL